MPRGSPPSEPVERIPLSGAPEPMPFSGVVQASPPSPVPKPSTFVQWFGARLLSRLLWVICGSVAVFLLSWWITRPSVAEVQDLFGASANAKEVLDALSILRRDHFDQFRDLFQLLILSVLVPLFTLLAGYAFGTRQMEKQAGAEEMDKQSETQAKEEHE